MKIIGALMDLIAAAVEEDYYDREPGEIERAYRKDTGSIILNCFDVYTADGTDSALNVLVGDKVFQIKIAEIQ